MNKLVANSANAAHQPERDLDRSAKKKVVTALLDRYGRTYASELGILLDSGRPSPLFRWLCAAILCSARISSGIAMKAAKAIADAGWTTAEKMAASTWEQRTKVLNRAGYARYDESTARMLGESTELLLSEYGGDLRRLRQRAGCAPGAERRLLKAFKGLGDVGVDIFMREVQSVWCELYPFADKRALKVAQRLGLGCSVEELSVLVEREDFSRFIAALVRAELAKDSDF